MLVNNEEELRDLIEEKEREVRGRTAEHDLTATKMSHSIRESAAEDSIRTPELTQS